jgi:bifunctional non-homologous end joining protein LigD
MQQASGMRLEGVVAKRRSSRYQPGKRTSDWLKVKHHIRQETVIGGWLAVGVRRQSRHGFHECRA